MKIIRKKGDRIRVQHNKPLFFIIIFLIILLIILIYFIVQGDGKKTYYFSDNNKCLTDEECVKVQTTCCSCNMGGKEECVLSSESEKYSEKLKQCQEDVLCAAFENCKIKSCKCVEGECVGDEN